VKPLANLSPKAIVAFALPFVAALILWRITGDETYLVGCLLAVLSGGGAAAAPPARGVEQRQVARVARGDAKIVPRDP
jgi:hypothetical protein